MTGLGQIMLALVCAGVGFIAPAIAAEKREAPKAAAPATAQHGFYGRHDVKNLSPEERQHWQSGQWHNENRGGRAGWWWVVDGLYYPYAQASSSYPELIPASPLDIILSSLPLPAQAAPIIGLLQSILQQPAGMLVGPAPVAASPPPQAAYPQPAYPQAGTMVRFTAAGRGYSDCSGFYAAMSASAAFYQANPQAYPVDARQYQSMCGR